MLRIAVCIKQIPLIEDANFDPVTRTIRRDGVNVISAFDLRAISLAMEFKQRAGAHTTAVTMGPPQARAALVDALAMGIDRAVHLEDRAFAGADTLATARALAAWLKREHFDLILLGKYSLDAETGQVGPEVAELLGIAQITGVRKVRIAGRALKAERESDEGYDEVECAMPAVLTCAERVAQPIRVKPEAAEKAGAQPIEAVRAAALAADPAHFGLAGSPTWVQEVRAVTTSHATCRMIDASDPVRAARQTAAALNELGALRPQTRPRRPIGAAMRKPARGNDLWVACETDLAGAVTRGSLELLSHGDALASRLGGALVAVGFPAAIARHAELLAGYGADHIIVLDHPALDAYTPAAAAEAMAHLVRERTPWGVLLCASERGRDWGPRLAARLGLGLTGDAIGIELDAERRMVALKPAFGGNIVAPILSKTFPQMATVRAGVLELAAPNAEREAAVETVRPRLAPALSRTVTCHSLLDETIAPLDGAQVVVGVGMGVGGPEGVAMAKDFARALGAGMCATRRVTDQGWMPRQLQVGLTGKAIDPRLYFALGVRGAPNHTVGIKRAQIVVAINNDPEAPIFEHATLGLVADYATVLPALTEALRANRGG
ncbi:MAG TPA: FAD-binding protein [Candidatus Binataceae bacterium]|nr:FAD-binding protein [Candidatus Binataceae bacterium]